MPPKKSNKPKIGDEKKAENRIKCIYCGNTYKTTNILAEHVKEKHAEVSIRCKNNKCPIYFRTEEEREKHNEDVHEKARDRKYPCSICRREFGRASNCRKHIKTVHKDEIFICSESGCCSSFTKRNEFERHYEKYHKKKEDLKIYNCEKCDHKTRTEQALKMHIGFKHGTKSLECDNCEKTFSSKIPLVHHMRNAHILQTCRYCGQDVVWMKEHSRKKQCQRCKRDFECSGLLEAHKKDRKDCNPPLHQCTKCLRVFPFKCLMELHKKKKKKKTCKPLNPNTEHEMQEATEEERSKQDGSSAQPESQEKTPNLIHCAHCSESFRCSYDLKSHLFSKHGLIYQIFECVLCEQKFLFKETLFEHLRVEHMVTLYDFSDEEQELVDHEKDRKDCKPPLHQCTKCLKAFSKKSRLELHKKKKTCNILKSNIEHEMQETTDEEQSKRYGSTVQPKVREKTSNLIHCAHCPESFPRFNALKRHLFSKHGLIDGRFECEPCQKKFLFLKNLIQHFRVAHMKTD